MAPICATTEAGVMTLMRKCYTSYELLPLAAEVSLDAMDERRTRSGKALPRVPFHGREYVRCASSTLVRSVSDFAFSTLVITNCCQHTDDDKLVV
jgi:hypothetical protein